METRILPLKYCPFGRGIVLGYVRAGCKHTFVYRRYELSDHAEVERLAGKGLSGYAISERLRIPRSTVQQWRRLPTASGRGRRSALRDWQPAHGRTYSYLLGIYLGDGHIVRCGPRSWRIDIYLDACYPAIVDEVDQALRAAYPGTAARRSPRPGAIALSASGVDWSAAFPQHGPGRKHNRPIELVDWQREITDEHPKALLRGLIHSDGCRTINRFETKLPSGRVATYAYPRYFFSNLSADIRGIFCEHCELLGIRWTQSNPRNISVSHRKSTALMDTFIGPKR